MEKRGIRTERGNINREIEVTNQNLRQLKARLFKLKDWLKEEKEKEESSPLADIISNILSRRSQSGKSSRYQTISNLKAVANMMNFLTSNNIKDMAGLDEKLQTMIGKQFGIRDELRPIERRLKVLDKHIEQAELYLKHKAVFKRFQQMANPKKKKDFTDVHQAEITLYESAERYLKGVMNGKTTLPTKAWKAEREKLISEKNRLNQEYIALKTETAEVEKIRSNVYDIMREETRETQRKRVQEMEK